MVADIDGVAAGEAEAQLKAEGIDAASTVCDVGNKQQVGAGSVGAGTAGGCWAPGVQSHSSGLAVNVKGRPTAASQQQLHIYRPTPIAWLLPLAPPRLPLLACSPCCRWTQWCRQQWMHLEAWMWRWPMPALSRQLTFWR